MRIATIVKDLNVYRNYPPFLEKLAERTELHLLYLYGEPFRKSDIRFHKSKVGKPSSISIGRELASLVNSVGIDVIYVLDGIFYEKVGLMASKMTDKALVVRLRTNELKVRKLSGENPLKTFLWHQIHKCVLKGSSGISVISHELQEYAQKIVRGRKPVKLIYHGVDCQQFRPMRMDKPYENAVLVVNGLRRLKGAEMLLKVAKQTPKVHYIVIGGADKVYLNSLPPNVHYHGFIERENMPTYYNMAHLTLMPTLTEGLPDVLLESLACGTPVVASKVGEIPFVLKEAFGWVVEEYSAEAYVKVLLEALNDKERLREMGMKGREYVVKNFTWDKFLNETLKLFEEVLGQH
ncbi:MAG: hypothetical protein DRJ59_06460 [Thermoprotei archaeon]|nr:MAG: hypothetical protein DRJ59_06460 [Thermoprotei archaeon]